MARPLKTGIDSFPVSVDFFNDEKVTALVGKYGMKGGAALMRVLCAIYRNGYYLEYTKETCDFIADDMPDVSAGLLNEMVICMVKIGIFDKDTFYASSVLTSRSIQCNYIEAVRRRKVSMSSLPYLLIMPDETPATAATPEPVHARRSTPTKETPVQKTPRRKATPKGTVQKAPPQPAAAAGTSAGTQAAVPAHNPQPQPAACAAPVVNAPPLQPAVCGNQANEACLARFFDPSNRANLELFMMHHSLKPDDIDRIRRLADIIVNAWNTTCTVHRDYADWARHLVNTLRIKLADEARKKPETQQPAPAAPAPDSYHYSGGFGGQDI